MTADEFFRRLSRTPRAWRLTGGKLRSGPLVDPDCPITAVARALVGEAAPAAGGVVRAADCLGLEGKLASRIVAAADDRRSADSGLRLDLLRACGLSAEDQRAAAVTRTVRRGD
ncbi:MAG: hypothetical protein GWN99_07170 [Gemmatimonadetes bacterium]|uniref:Uncharacterized protein n=1 Tax=Candidatus Kutchimonas denitrificans TaxID=3056748 RepID=A0AAE5CCN8_9BACT|nr:hypothetical protein [Gemmatimonadota bacterium]NIR74444.1 hypothetical protein [Candidatus Kutchimonas denitrificans]NIS00840.1 hypothetical protein [Gemmatimonadota bacterium]NIT66463.1 hypothetical protein [Gemmatimonadota bacterium]NIU52094.1 hypothetical protein [Gemmatimonadota bacterium]